jgi:hypothetical protein
MDDDPNDMAPGSLSGRAPSGDLPPLAERLERAREDARQRRIEAGLPAEPEPSELEKLWAERPKGKRGGKKSKDRSWTQGGSRR